MDPFLFLLVLTSSLCMYPQPSTSVPHNNLTDLASLLAFRSQLADPLGVLSTNWTTNTSFCNWFGVTCSKRHHRVAAIKLYDIHLQGTISPHLANLSFLSVLFLDNTSLVGPIPNALTHLPRLRRLTLQRNYLSGSLPPSLFNMSSLVRLGLSTNNLSGSLPSNHSDIMCPRLQFAAMGENQLAGRIPTTFAQCSDLQVLFLAENVLTGPVPADLGYLVKLEVLHLDTNQLSGEIPPSLGNLTNLQDLDLYTNNLAGGIPKELGNLSKLRVLSIANNGMTGSIPEPLLNATMLTTIDFTKNHLIGSVPPTLGASLSLLEFLSLSANTLTGSLNFITSLYHCHNLQYLLFTYNEFDGILPISVGNLSRNLLYLDMGANKIKGNIPTELGNLSSVLRLQLGGNELTGAIPPTIARLHNLQVLHMGGNKIGGSIPKKLGLMTNLISLTIESNQLSGAIPGSIGNLTGLQTFSLAANKIASKVPMSMWKLSGLITLDLSRNALFGSIPQPVSSLKVLDKFDLSMNQLSGNITTALGELKMLTYLGLSNNSFHGQIPESFGGLISIQHLDLSKNFLSGSIPKSLANLCYLDSLNLSFNMLEGQIPEGKVFSNLSISSLEGNKALCGASQLGFPSCPASISNSLSRRKSHLLNYILPTIASIVALSCLIFLYTIRRKRKSMALPLNHMKSQNLGNQRVVSYHDLRRATNNFSQENLLGKGNFSSVFRGYLDEESIVAVKVLSFEVEGASKSFDAECRALCCVRHRNLIKIISVCFNLDFKAIILQYMPKGSLEQWLHLENYNLNLLQRLNIMVDVSSALEYLHHRHPQVILHCDLKPSNVLLDEDMVAHVSDFGIAKLLHGNISAASASTPGTIGYIAPEYGSTGEVSKTSDVYSFGILLLETFTGKRPTDIMFHGESTLRETVCKAYPAGLLNIVDDNILKDDFLTEPQFLNIVDDNILKDDFLTEPQFEDQTVIVQCLSSIIELGVLCSSYSPKERIPMVDVVSRLKKIKAKYLS